MQLDESVFESGRTVDLLSCGIVLREVDLHEKISTASIFLTILLSMRGARDVWGEGSTRLHKKMVILRVNE